MSFLKIRDKEIEQYKALPEALEITELNVIENPDLAQKIATHFETKHESPQVLFISDGKCQKAIDHYAIILKRLKEFT
ncbi:hypothetical protein CMI47_11370 [Candidatus Pacearchaeota archaeon]|nr:hypothetical protein [Candidatus Pacearchaeota archaeon]